MTTKELISKYPKIFQQYPGDPFGVNWSGVPEGWLPIIDKLCGAIQSCDNACEDCGSEQDLGVTRGWISVLCRTCVMKNGDRAMNSWEPKTNNTNENTEGESSTTGR